MNRGLYTIASGGLAAQARLDAVAQNLANVNTVGYKSQRVAFDVQTVQHYAPVRSRLSSTHTVAHLVGIEQTRDFSPGPMVSSGNPLDVAIAGRGFFVVSTAAGEHYTRQGTFAVDAEGMLVTARGDRVQGDGGDVNVGREGAVVIAPDGTVSVEDTPVGRLRLVDFGDAPGLVGAGDALFAAAPGATPTPLEPEAVDVRQGMVEQANVDAVAGLVELIDVARGYEAYMRAIQRLDDIARRTIEDIGRVG
jgi:flagellar basal-body rod protein FlgF